MKEIYIKTLAGSFAGLFVAAIGHFVGENAALAVVGGWVFLTLNNK